MFDLSKWSDIMSIAAAIPAVCGAVWFIVRLAVIRLEKSRIRHKAELLQTVKDGDAALNVKLDSKVHELETSLADFKKDIDKDMAHLKETYNGELKFLGQKIEELRKEVHNQHGQLVDLLLKMIDK